MPTINLSFDITQTQASVLSEWFNKWNLTLDTPYASWQDFLTDVIRREVVNRVNAYYSISASELSGLTFDQIDRIRAIINE